MLRCSNLVQGIGTKGNNYPSSKQGKKIKEYSLWVDMLLRCTEKYQTKRPSYVATICSENFKSYSYFYEWCQEQKGFGNTDENERYWQLDKDILIKGNKLYSEDTCVFVPSRINTLLIKSNSVRGEYPLGVCWHKNRNQFVSSCSGTDRVKNHLGLFSTPEEAFQAYKLFKEEYIKMVAEEYKSQLDTRTYEALMNYTVEITD